MKSRIAVSASCVIGIVLLLALELERSYRREVDNAELVTAAMARLLERELLVSVGKIDLITQEAKCHYKEYLNGGGLPAEQMNPTLKRLLGRVPGVLSLRLVNEQGKYVFDAKGQASSAVIADRQYFRGQQSGKVSGLFAEGPIFSRVANIWTITFSRGVHDQEGRFRGIVQSSIPSEWLATAFSSVSVGNSDAVALVNSEPAFVVLAAPCAMSRSVPMA